jgi:hypothetical protein
MTIQGRDFAAQPFHEGRSIAISRKLCIGPHATQALVISAHNFNRRHVEQRSLFNLAPVHFGKFFFQFIAGGFPCFLGSPLVILPFLQSFSLAPECGGLSPRCPPQSCGGTTGFDDEGLGLAPSSGENKRAKNQSFLKGNEAGKKKSSSAKTKNRHLR